MSIVQQAANVLPGWALAVVISAAAPAWSDPVVASDAAPKGLMCELLGGQSVSGITDPRPDFTWIVPRKITGGQQLAYEIELGHPADSGAPSPSIWNSGRVPSHQSCAVEYDGPPLENRRAYSWRVRVWGRSDAPSPWSEPQEFSTAQRWAPEFTPTHAVASERQPPKVIRQAADGTCFADFGRAAFGYAELRLPEGIDATITVRFGEKLLDGRIDQQPGGTIRCLTSQVRLTPEDQVVTLRPPPVRRNTSGKAIRLPDSMGVVAPFRYLEIEGLPKGLPSADNLETCTRIAYAYPFDEDASRFRSSDPMLNAIWDLCKYSVKATTFCGVYVDGDRERIPYEADAYINQLCHYGVDREYAIARRSHEYLLDNPTWPTEWKQHSVLIAWEDYLYTGDRESLEANYDRLKSEKVLGRHARSDGLLDTSRIVRPGRDIIDWPAGERDGYEGGPVNSVVNAFHYRTLELMRRIATELGRDKDAAEFHAESKRVYHAFQHVFWRPADGRFVDSEESSHASVHANLFPLAFGLVGPEQTESVVSFLKTRGLACSVYGAQFLLDGLYQHGRADYALQLMTSRGERSWSNMIDAGSTITLEAWGKQFKPNLDWNHAWGAAPANIIPRYVAGVRPGTPGFRNMVVQPQPGNLSWFASQVPTIRGPVELNYSGDDTGYSLKVDLPANTATVVGLPALMTAAQYEVTHNGVVKRLGAEAPAGSCHAPIIGWTETLHGGTHEFKVRRLAEQPVLGEAQQE